MEKRRSFKYLLSEAFVAKNYGTCSTLKKFYELRTVVETFA
jgi:hypothetical protein